MGGGGTTITYLGGEPLLNPSLLHWVEQSDRLKLDFHFTTNGYKLDQEMARRLVAANLFNIRISLESLEPSINEAIRSHRNGTKKTVEAIELLLEEKQRQHSRLSINIKCTFTDQNLESILDIVQRWGKFNGVFITPQMFEALDGMPSEVRQMLWIDNIDRIKAVVGEMKKNKAEGYNINADDRALDDFIRFYRKDPEHSSILNTCNVVVNDQPDCYIGTDNLFITNGAVKLCPQFPPIGNVLNGDQTLREMWYSDKAHQMRIKMRQCRILCTLSCTRRTTFLHKLRTFLKM